MRTGAVVEDGGDLLCRHCGMHLARIVDGVFCVGSIKIYGKIKFFCSICARGYTYQEPLSPPDETPVGTLEIINGLGKEYSGQWYGGRERAKRKKFENNS